MASTPPATVYLVASGSTVWEQDERLQGNTDLPLSPEGTERVARAAAHQPLPEQLRVIYTAPDEASRQTAAALAAEAHARVRPIEELEEMDLGLWQGMRQTELADRYAKAFGQWQTEPGSVAIPEGESLQDAADRVRKVFNRLLDRHGDEPFAVVLRPILLGLARRYLRGEALDKWRGEVPEQLVERVEVARPARSGARPRRPKRRKSA